jgi:hypothetical protein
VPMVWDRGEKVNPLSAPPVDFFSTGGTSCIKPWTGKGQRREASGRNDPD